MSESPLQNWVMRNTSSIGLLALGIYAAEKANFIQPCAGGLATPGLENAWRCVAETIPVLQLNRFPTARFRFVYGDAVVHCERRRDGTCLGIFARRENGVCPESELERLLAEFHALS
jgi:hypothetical protein